MKVTIKKIAQLSGVSRGTVDRVLNDRPGVKPDVRERIETIIAELNFVPNGAAKALAYNRKPAVFAIIMPPKNIAFFNEIRRGIESCADELKDWGIRLEYRYVSNRDPREAINTMDELINMSVSGILFSVMDDPQIRESIIRAVDCGIPVITFNSDVENSKRLCFVGQDLYKSGRVAASLMSRITQENAGILIVTGNMKFQAHRARVQGFVDRSNEISGPLKVYDIIEGYDTYEDTYEKLSNSLNYYPQVKGIYMATGNINACIDVIKKNNKEKALHVICNDTQPEVLEALKQGIFDFTIVQNPFMQGYTSLKLLYDFVFKGKKPASETIFSEIGIQIPENFF